MMEPDVQEVTHAPEHEHAAGVEDGQGGPGSPSRPRSLSSSTTSATSSKPTPQKKIWPSRGDTRSVGGGGVGGGGGGLHRSPSASNLRHRSFAADSEPEDEIPLSYKARRSYRMDTIDDYTVYAASRTASVGPTGPMPHPHAELEDDHKSHHTVEEKHMMINQLFGMHPWVDLPAEDDTTESEEAESPSTYTRTAGTFANYTWVVIAGWWLCGLYMIVGGIISLTGTAKDYSSYCFRAGAYMLWPFDRQFYLHNPKAHIDLEEVSGANKPNTKTTALLRDRGTSYSPSEEKPPLPSRILWYILCSIFLTPFHALVGFVCWLLIILVPMGRMNFTFLKANYQEDVRFIEFSEGAPAEGETSLFFTHTAFDRAALGRHVFGINIVLANMLFLVILSICLRYVFPPLFGWEEPHFIVLFILSTVSIIPIAYYIGMAIASISVQVNFAAGAVLNASFGSFIELMLYWSAMKEGSLNELVQASVTGTLLGMMLLLPGLSMIAGGIKYKEQRFNKASTGVSQLLLSISIVGAFTPTIFYASYGGYLLECEGCDPGENSTAQMSCAGCTWSVGELTMDRIFEDAVRPLSTCCAIILPLGYFAGIWFTLKTHSHIYDEPLDENHEGGGGHDGPGWSRAFSIGVLLVSAVLFGLISEELVESLNPVLELLDVPPRFAGLTFVALITSTVEFLNAILFAYHNDLALSLEVANAYCVQVSLIQLPALVLMSLAINYADPDNLPFTLVFPNLDLFAVIMGLMILNFTWAEGKGNYFVGIILVFIYILFVAAFWYVPVR